MASSCTRGRSDWLVGGTSCQSGEVLEQAAKEGDGVTVIGGVQEMF